MSQLSRRGFAKILLATPFFIHVKPNIVMAGPSEKSLRLYNVHTGETAKTTFWEKGKICQEGLKELNHLMRDFRTGDVIDIDCDLYHLIHAMNEKTGNNDPLLVVSGYRSRKTNEMLRRGGRGVARNSYHVKGMAVDMRSEHISLRNMKKAAQSLKKGGVGYYGRSGFVHLDTGPVRYW